MSVLRKLSMIYLLSASAFSMLFVIDRNPNLDQTSRNTVAAGLDAIRNNVTNPIAHTVRSGADFASAAVRFGSATAPTGSPVVTIPVAPLPPIALPATSPLAAPEPSFAPLKMPKATVPGLSIAAEADHHTVPKH